MSQDFTTVTELAGDEVSAEQITRLAQRYFWAGPYCRDKDVLEIACGSGQGLGYLASVSRKVEGGDITPSLVDQARRHYGNRLQISVMDAEKLPLDAASIDVVILFEAIYYLHSPVRFIRECKRVLRPSGIVLISTANKDLYDFNPSPYSNRYFGCAELRELFEGNGFSCELFGSTPIGEVSFVQRVLRPIKAFVVKFDLMPKTMNAKKLLKRLVFGRLVQMPAEINQSTAAYTAPQLISESGPNRSYKAILVAAKLRS